MKVRKAIIPAAGWGTRLLPATKAIPKEMLPVVDKPAIQYVVEEAAASGIREVLFVISRGKGAIMNHFDRSPVLERELASKERQDLLRLVRETSRMAECFFIRQPDLRGLGDAVRRAKAFAGDEPLAVLLPDDLIDAQVPCLQQLIDVQRVTGGSVIAVQAVKRDQIANYGIVEPGDSPMSGVVRVQGLVEKPQPEAAPSNLGVVGRYLLSPRIFHHLAALRPGKGGELQLTDALQGLLGEEPIYAHRFKGVRSDMGTVEGFLEANLRYALNRPDLGPAVEACMQKLLAARAARQGEPAKGAVVVGRSKSTSQPVA